MIYYFSVMHVYFKLQKPAFTTFNIWYKVVYIIYKHCHFQRQDQLALSQRLPIGAYYVIVTSPLPEILNGYSDNYMVCKQLIDIFNLYTCKFILLTCHVFTDVSHSSSGARRHISPLVVSLEYGGVVDHHWGPLPSSRSKGAQHGREAVEHHFWVVCSFPDAIFGFSSNEPTITSPVCNRTIFTHFILITH